MKIMGIFEAVQLLSNFVLHLIRLNTFLTCIFAYNTIKRIIRFDSCHRHSLWDAVLAGTGVTGRCLLLLLTCSRLCEFWSITYIVYSLDVQHTSRGLISRKGVSGGQYKSNPAQQREARRGAHWCQTRFRLKLLSSWRMTRCRRLIWDLKFVFILNVFPSTSCVRSQPKSFHRWAEKNMHFSFLCS